MLFKRRNTIDNWYTISQTSEITAVILNVVGLEKFKTSDT